jgi:hypothetical protein
MVRLPVRQAMRTVSLRSTSRTPQDAVGGTFHDAPADASVVTHDLLVGSWRLLKGDQNGVILDQHEGRTEPRAASVRIYRWGISPYDKGTTGDVLINYNGDRTNKWMVWSFNPGQGAYEKYLLIDITKPVNEVRRLLMQRYGPH